MRDKVTSLNLFFLWSIITPRVCCNIPYHLASYLGNKAAISRAGSPINGGHFITHLAISYGLIIPCLTKMLTHKPGDDLSMGYLESMCVAVNMGSHWIIPIDDDMELHNHPEHQLLPRGRRNVRAHGERGQSQHPLLQFEGGVLTDPFQIQVGTYLDNLHGGVNYNTQILDTIFTHMNVVRPPTIPPQCPYIPTWEELWIPGDDGAGGSGAQDEDDD